MGRPDISVEKVAGFFGVWVVALIACGQGGAVPPQWALLA